MKAPFTLLALTGIPFAGEDRGDPSRGATETLDRFGIGLIGQNIFWSKSALTPKLHHGLKDERDLAEWPTAFTDLFPTF